MIQAYLNNEEIKLFPEMAIGITIENFNISDLANRKIDRTNTIRVPKVGNEAAFEFSSIPNAPTDFVYNDYDFDLIVDGILIYENGRAFITGENDKSYTLHITNNKNIVDLLKSIKLADLYDGDEIILVTLTTWKDLFKEETNGFKIDSLFKKDYPPNPNEYKYSVETNYLSIYLTTILAKIETDYSITFSGTLLTDVDYLKMRIPIIQCNLKEDLDPGTADIYVDGIVIHDSLTAWDLIKNILQLFCGVFKINGIDLELQKLNDLNTINPIDWTGKLVSKTKKFSIPNTGQKNYIRYAVASEVDKDLNSVIVECNNTNIVATYDLATMKAKLFPKEMRDSAEYTSANDPPTSVVVYPALDRKTGFVSFGLSVIINSSTTRGLTDLVILVDSEDYLGQPLTIALTYYRETAGALWEFNILNGSLTSDADTTLTEYYDPTANYSLIETMLTDPVFYEAELLLNIIDIYGFDHFKAVRIDELEGIFYVNKIINFLATSPGVPTKVELIKIAATSNLIVGFVNRPGLGFETLITDGSIIISAINTVSHGQAGSSVPYFTVDDEEVIRVIFDLDLTSGTLPSLRIFDPIGVATISNISAVIDGSNVIDLVVTADSTSAQILFVVAEVASNFSTSNVFVKRIS